MIQKIDQPQPWSLVFEIHQRRERVHLYFSGQRRFSRIHLTNEKHPNPSSPPRFCQLLRAHLRWKQIVSLEQIGGDRIVRMTCAWPERRGPGAGDSGPDQGEIKQVQDLSLKSDDQGNDPLSSTPQSALRNRHSISPGTLSLVAELMGTASNFFLIDHQGIVLGSLFPPPAGRALQIGLPYLPPALHPTGLFKETEIPLVEPGPYRFNRSVEATYRPLQEKTAEEEEKRRLTALIDEGIRRCRKKLQQISIGLAEAEKADRFRYEGELLKGHLRHVRTGMTEVKIPDPAHPDQAEMTLSLDPALSPSENLERFFKRYKKAQAAQAALQTQREKTKKELEALERNRTVLLEGGTVAMAGKTPVPTRREKGKRAGPPTFLSADGWSVIVGRNHRENEEITFRTARGNDLWFHARGVPGSHLIVRMDRGKEIPYQTLLDAATLALHFSDGRKEGKGDVVYTFRKYIQKPKGAKPGAVLVSQEKNIYIEIEPKRLERLLASTL
ncbi:MAG: NFACT family protein [Candidatus Manganitrophus sp.]|nr:MAG: NFACT family protein [Candidatus Manganitrophus sp.]